MDLGLQGKTAIVAGGSRGIGRAIAKALAREGVDIALVSRSLPDLEAAAAEIAGESGRRVVALACDVAKRDDVDRTVERAVETLGGLHILVNSGSNPADRRPRSDTSTPSSTTTCSMISMSSTWGRSASPAPRSPTCGPRAGGGSSTSAAATPASPGT